MFRKIPKSQTVQNKKWPWSSFRPCCAYYKILLTRIVDGILSDEIKTQDAFTFCACVDFRNLLFFFVEDPFHFRKEFQGIRQQVGKAVVSKLEYVFLHW